MARNERHAEKSPAESHTRTLVLALLHTFDPLLVSLADALHSAVPLPSSALSSPASTHNVKRAAPCPTEAHSASASSASLDTSPPSPLERTHVFPSHASTDSWDCIGGVDARSMESLPSPEVPLVDGALLSTSPAPVTAAVAAGVARKRPREQPPRSTSAPVRACMMAEPADVATRFFFALPNEVLCEAVAALAEAMLVGGCCFCWLRAAASREGKVEAESRRGKRSSGGGSSTVPSYLLLARVLLHLDHYAREELSAFLVAHRRLCVPAESQTNVDRVAVYVNVAATVVRAVALHAARLLCSVNANDGDDDSSVCGSGSAPLVSAVLAPSSSSLTATAAAAATESADISFRAVQDSVRQQQRQSQQQDRQANNVDTPPSPGRSARAGQRRAATGSANFSEKNGASAAVATLSPPLLSLPLRQLLRRGREAEEADESAFLLLLHDTPPSPLRVASPPRTGSATGTSIADDSGFLACVLQTGAVVAAEGAAHTVVALSSALPELLDGAVRTAAAAVLHRSAPSTKDLSRAPKNTEKADEDVVPASAAILATWCAELYHLSVQAPATEILASRLCTDFTLAATRLYHDLHDGAVNTQAGQTARCAADKSRRAVSPTLRASQPITKGVADAMNTPAEDGAARWRIRPCMGMSEEETSSAEDRTRGPSTSGSRRAGRTSGVAAPTGLAPSSRGAVASCGGILPTVEWVRLADPPPTHDGAPRVAPTAVDTASSSAALFSYVLGLSTVTAATAAPLPQPASSASPLPTAENDRDEALGEVGSVLACIDGVCASRTLLDVWAWRYGRNRFNVAAASVVSVRNALDHAESNGERSSASTAVLLPADAVVTRTGLAAATATAADTGPCGDGGAIGLYHHESGLLYVAGGDTYAMEID